MKSDGTVNCVIVGDDGIGKNFFVLGNSSGNLNLDILASNTDTHQLPIRFRSRKYNLTIYDEAANTKNRASITSRNLQYAQADLFLVCFSTGDKTSFKSVITKWIPEIRRFSPATPIVLIGISEIDPFDVDHKQMKVRFIESQTTIPFDHCVKLAAQIKAKAYLECDSCKKSVIRTVFEEAILVTLGPSMIKPQFKLNCFCVA